MIRLSRLTDYGIVLMATLAQGDEGATHNARELAAEVGLPDPVVSKLLKTLARGGLLESHRGAKGGYSLARSPREISVPEMIEVLEGPIHLTDCAQHSGACEKEPSCQVREPWQLINAAVHDALARISLADLAAPASVRVIPLTSLGVDPRSLDAPSS
jgi:FeS assembly SUF system regulator